ncbi:MAG: fibronectin type III domain-containing protein, partial [Brachybacterium sp.]
ASTSCTITGLTNDTEYTFQVVATNDVGDSDPSVPSAVARPDVRPEKPAAPRAERGDQQLTVGWSAPENRGSAIQSYEVQVQDTSGQGISSQTVEGGSTQTVFSGLTNGVDYRFRVRASNLADEPSEWSEWSSAEHPAGKPKAPSGTASAERIDDPVGGGVTVTWPAMTDAEANGEPITQYVVKSSSGATQTVDGGTTKATFRDLDRDSKHTFTYTGVNSVGTGTGASKASNAVTPWAVPKAPTGVKASMPSEGEGDGPNGRATVSWTAADGGGTTVTKYVVRWNGGSKTVDAPATSVDLSGLSNGTSYRFTVEARNGFAKDGGVSPRSAESNSVKPYTKPANPSLSTSNGKCTDGNNCPVTVKASAGGSDGGAGGKTLQVRINGGSWQDSGTSFSKTYQVKTGGNVKVEARVKNSKGLFSGTVSKTQGAQTYTPPKPSAAPGSPSWQSHGGANSNTKCTSGQNCTYFTITFENLEPGKDYKVVYQNTDPATGQRSNWATFTVTGDSNGRDTSPVYFYGYQERHNNPNSVFVNGKEILRFSAP